MGFRSDARPARRPHLVAAIAGALFLASAAAFLPSCSVGVRLDPAAVAELEPGVTMRREIVLRFGEPTAIEERSGGGVVLVYAAASIAGGEYWTFEIAPGGVLVEWRHGGAE